MGFPRSARLALAAATAATIIGLSALPAFAGEVTGNGRLLPVHGRSSCAFSGQEDLQFFTDDSDQVRLENPVKGVPGHAQSWGQIPKAVRDAFPAFMHPGIACNPMRSQGE